MQLNKIYLKVLITTEVFLCSSEGVIIQIISVIFFDTQRFRAPKLNRFV